ncbi:MAG: ferritin-like domain-containing protein [Pseudomonadota bacterium]
MNNSELIAMLNRDLADEHAATIRYLVHGWLEGEDTPMGAGLLSRAREEMWHMHWLGMIIGQLGGEPDFTPAGYPHDPTNRTTIFKSYVAYEKKLIPHYNSEAAKVDDPHTKRVLLREAWESAVHAQKFQKLLDKLKPEEAAGTPERERELPQDFLQRLQAEVTSKNNEMLQHVRHSWVLQKNGIVAWELMDQAMTKMKQLAHFAEDIAENGVPPLFKPGPIDRSADVGQALKHASEELKTACERHLVLKEDGELMKHTGLVINLNLTIQQEEYQIAELEEMRKKS